MKPTIFFYVQHLLGVGHQMRASQLARAMTSAGLEVHYVSGGFNEMAVHLGGATLHQLPPIRSSDAGFSGLVDEIGKPVDHAYWQRRLTQMQKIVDEINPAAYLIEGFPFARRKFSKELIPLLEKANVPVFCSVRDILVPPSNDKKAAMAMEQVKSHFAKILVHGDEDFIPLSQSFPSANQITDKLVYTGYVAPDFNEITRPEKGEILVSAGGGAVGEKLLTAAIALAHQSPNQTWRFLIGPNLPTACVKALKDGQSDTITVEPARADFRKLLAKSKFSISQAGYNTVMDLMVTKTPSILVPFGSDKESEQPTRAKLLAHHNLVIYLDESNLTPDSLDLALKEALGLPPIDSLPFKLQGAETSASYIKSAIEGGL